MGQRFYHDHVTLWLVQDWLVPNLQLLGYYGRAQALFNLHTLLYLFLQAIGKLADAPLAHVLCLIHGEIGLADELVSFHSTLLTEGDTDRTLVTRWSRSGHGHAVVSDIAKQMDNAE